MGGCQTKGRGAPAPVAVDMLVAVASVSDVTGACLLSAVLTFLMSLSALPFDRSLLTRYRFCAVTAGVINGSCAASPSRPGLAQLRSGAAGGAACPKPHCLTAIRWAPTESVGSWPMAITIL